MRQGVAARFCSLKRGTMPNDTPANQPWSRYQRVKKILDDASGDAHPSYQGAGRFWDLPLDQFLTFKLYGIPIIAPTITPPGAAAPAPAGPTPCCHAPPKQAAAAIPAVQPAPGRGAASGLIIGLKGQAPFD